MANEGCGYFVSWPKGGEPKALVRFEELRLDQSASAGTGFRCFVIVDEYSTLEAEVPTHLEIAGNYTKLVGPITKGDLAKPNRVAVYGDLE